MASPSGGPGSNDEPPSDHVFLPEVTLYWTDFVWSLEKLRHRAYSGKMTEHDWYCINPLEMVLLGCQTLADDTSACRDHGTFIMRIENLREKMYQIPRYWRRAITVLSTTIKGPETPSIIIQSLLLFLSTFISQAMMTRHISYCSLMATPFNVSIRLDGELSSNQLVDILSLLNRHGYAGEHFQQLGLFLGLFSATLGNIETDYRDVETRLQACLKKWLQKADNVVEKGGPSMKSLISALKSIHQNATASGIESELQPPACKIFDDYMNRSKNLLAELLPQLAATLHSEGIIGRIQLPTTAEIVHISVKEAIYADHHNLGKFATVLRRFNSELGAGIQNEYSKLELEEPMPTRLQAVEEETGETNYKKKCNELSRKNKELKQEIALLKKEASPKHHNPIFFENDVYGDIVIDHPLLVKIVKTRQFQRLRDIKQLGYTYLSVPKASYSRLQHNIGMCFLAGKFVKQLKKRQPELDITESDVLCVQVAALCYNLGFGPFSYTFNTFLTKVTKSQEDFKRPWKTVAEASVKMFEYMIEDNALKPVFEEYHLTDDDIEFITELILGVKETKKRLREDKKFLYEIIRNKPSGLDVYTIDSTVRDSVVAGKNSNFKWRAFINKVHVLEFDGKQHICVQEEDLATYNDFFSARAGVYRELYYHRKTRIAALMIERILVKSKDFKIIGGLTLLEAASEISTFTQLTDGVLNIIRSTVDDKEVQMLLDCLDTLRFIAQIGYFTPPTLPSPEEMKKLVAKETDVDDKGKIEDLLIIDPIESGYDQQERLQYYYYSSDDNEYKVDKWTASKWAKPPNGSNTGIRPPWRVFLVSGNRELIQKVKDGLTQAIGNEEGQELTFYPDLANADLMPDNGSKMRLL